MEDKNDKIGALSLFGTIGLIVLIGIIQEIGNGGIQGFLIDSSLFLLKIMLFIVVIYGAFLFNYSQKMDSLSCDDHHIFYYLFL